MTSLVPHQQHGDRTRPVTKLVDCFDPGPMTVLNVWAHPDDESLLAGGILAEIARRGGEVVTVTATAGEHGTDDPIAEPPASLAARRSNELDAALRMLGAAQAIHLGYGDGTCDQVTEHLAAHLIGRIIDRIQPDLILTFGPDGVTGHPDHRAVARWVRSAVATRGDQIPLLTTVAASAWPTDAIERLHGIDAFWPGYPITADVTGAMAVRLDPELLDRKLAALSFHASQMRPVTAALGTVHLVDLAAVESYVAANSAARDRLSRELMAQAA